MNTRSNLIATYDGRFIKAADCTERVYSSRPPVETTAAEYSRRQMGGQAPAVVVRAGRKADQKSFV